MTDRLAARPAALRGTFEAKSEETGPCELVLEVDHAMPNGRTLEDIRAMGGNAAERRFLLTAVCDSAGIRNQALELSEFVQTGSVRRLRPKGRLDAPRASRYESITGFGGDYGVMKGRQQRCDNLSQQE